jgi:hypothetical protein
VVIMLARMADRRVAPGNRWERRAVAAVWSLVGDEADKAAAEAWAAKEGYHVFTYPADVIDPLGCAKRDARYVDGEA